MKLREISPV